MSRDLTNAGFNTRCVHAGQSPDPSTGAVSTPVYLTSTYAQPSPGVFKGDYDYSRSANPTRTAYEANIASLEDAKHGLAFSSGVASLSAVIHLLSSGDHVVLCDDVYGGTYRVFKMIFDQLGITSSRVDMTDHDATEAAMTDKTRLVWLETPTNPTLKIINIKEIARIAHAHNALLAVDNTFASPVLQHPLALGADVVSHSSTKYIGGHADVVGGVLVANDTELYTRLRFVQNAVGAVPGPMDCFLLLRSTKTLGLRVHRQCESAATIASHFEGHAKLEKVIYPGLKSHPQHELASEQMPGFGAMLSIVLKGGLDAARTFLENVELFTLAESLGGVESLVELPAIMTHATVPAEERAKLGISDGLVRLSVGIEDVADQIADIQRALDAVG